MTELAWLIDLLLTSPMPPAIRKRVAERIKDVEERMSSTMQVSWHPGQPPKPLPPHIASQAPSMQAIMARHPEIGVVPPPEPVAVIAQTPATIAALNSRQEAIDAALSGKVDKASGRPRKF